MTKELKIGRLYKQITRDTKEENIICVRSKSILDPQRQPQLELAEKMTIVWFYYIDKPDTVCMTGEDDLFRDYIMVEV